MKYTEIFQERKAGTKTVYIEVSRNERVLTMAEAELMSKRLLDSIAFFRRMGGKETKKMGYTSCGYILTDLISTSPDRESRTVRTLRE